MHRKIEYLNNQYLKPFPEGIVLSTLEQAGFSEEQLCQFYNKNYSSNDEESKVFFSTDYIHHILGVDDSIEEQYKSLQKSLSLVLVNQSTQECVGAILVQLINIENNGSKSVAVTASMTCIAQSYRLYKLGPQLIAHCYQRLQSYDLAKTAIFSGKYLPFKKVAPLQNNYVDLRAYYSKEKAVQVNSHYSLREFIEEDTLSVMSWVNMRSRKAVLVQVFKSDVYFWQRFKTSDSTYSFTVSNDQGEILGWFSGYQLAYQYQHVEYSIWHITLAVSDMISESVLADLIIHKALELNVQFVAFPEKFSCGIKSHTDISLEKSGRQWVYCVDEVRYNNIEGVDILFF